MKRFEPPMSVSMKEPTPALSEPAAPAFPAGGPSVTRPVTIAVMSDYISFLTGGYEGRVRHALLGAAREQGVRLRFYYGRAYDPEDPTARAHNFVFDLVEPSQVDGVILLSPVLAGAMGSSRLSEFTERYRAIPRCSLGTMLKGVPSVTIDGRPPMTELVEHLLRVHECRRFAFVGGFPNHPDSEERRTVLEGALRRHGFQLDPRLTVHGGFTKHGGVQGAQELLALGVPIDAIVCANDAMAVGVQDVLRREHLSVPGQVRVTGFDDLGYAQLADPPLTTVAQPFDEMAEAAIRSVLEQCRGRAPEDICCLNAELVVRHSCGCAAAVYDLGVSDAPDEARLSESIRRHLGTLVDYFGRVSHKPSAPARTFLELLAERETCDEWRLQESFDAWTQRCDLDGQAFQAVRQILGWLREHCGPRASPEQWALLRRFDERLFVRAMHALGRQRADLDEGYSRLLGAGERIALSLELEDFEEILRGYFTSAGVSLLVLSRFVDEDQRTLEGFVHVAEGRAFGAATQPFPRAQLVPTALLHVAALCDLVVIPLVFEARCHGLAVFEFKDGIIGYQMVCDQVSAAFHATTLHREIIQKTRLHERSVQERIAATERMEALRVLAGGVAHDLNNSLGPLVALPELIVGQLDASESSPEARAELRADVESMKLAALRAVQTIRDLLTLSREGRTTKVPLELNRLVGEGFAAAGARASVPAGGRVKLVLELSDSPLFIMASEAHLLRALQNLVRNACDAIDVAGTVTIRTSRALLEAPHLGYETVPTGDYVRIVIHDDGRGLPSGARSRLFEPFFTTKQLGQHSGTGLGLAIVHGVVKEHGGYLDVSGDPSQGTSFYIYLPRAPSALERTTRLAEVLHGTERILLVDDDPMQLRTGRRVLKHYGYDVVAVSDPEVVDRLFARASAEGGSPYDVVLMDMQLAGERDGLQVLEDIRRQFPDQKAIILSGHSRNERIAVAVALGIPWIVKPYTVETLARAIRAIISGTRLAHVVDGSSAPPAR